MMLTRQGPVAQLAGSEVHCLDHRASAGYEVCRCQHCDAFRAMGLPKSRITRVSSPC
jgi:hypothetical protein